MGERVARAHGVPVPIGLAWPSADSEVAPTVVSSRGLIFPSTDPQAFQLRCSTAYGALELDRPRVFFEPAEGRIVIANWNGVQSSADRGCSWQRSAGLPEQDLLATAQHPREPARLLASTSAALGVTTGLWASGDGGLRWSKLADNEPDERFESLVFAPSSSQRLFAGGQRYDTDKRTVVWLFAHSSDGGNRWVRRETATRLTPLFVDPEDANIVYASEAIDAAQTTFRLLRSQDGGEHFESVAGELAAITAHAFNQTDRKLWLGTESGLYLAENGESSFRQVHPSLVDIPCLAYQRNELWICAQTDAGDLGVWISGSDDSTLERFLAFDQVTGTVACTEEGEEVCTLADREWEVDLSLWGQQEAGDAGASDAGASDASSDQPAASGCGIMTAEESSSPLPLLAAWLLGARLLFVRLFSRFG